MRERASLPGQRVHDTRVGMAQRRHRDPRAEIEIFSARLIPHAATLPPRQAERETSVRGQDVLTKKFLRGK